MKKQTNGDDLREVLKRIMKTNNLTVNSWSKLAGTSEGTLRFFLNGTNNSLKVSTLRRFLEPLGLGVKDLDITESIHRVDIYGYVNQTAGIDPWLEGVSPKENQVSLLSTLPLTEVCAVKVLNDNSLPLIRKDWVIYYHAKANLEKCTDKLCIVTTHDKSMYIKELSKGSKDGFYDLVGHNLPTMHNIQVTAAYPIISIEPR